MYNSGWTYCAEKPRYDLSAGRQDGLMHRTAEDGMMPEAQQGATVSAERTASS